MTQFLLYAALLQAGLITLYLGIRLNRKSISSVLLFILIMNYTLLMFRFIWNDNMDVQLNKLHLPFSYAMGPVFYYFVRFGFIPLKNQLSKRWMLWFIPFVLQILVSVAYWLTVALKSPIALEIESFAKRFFSFDFFYFLAFFVATIIFLVRHNPLITMNLIYKKQLKLLKYFMFFITLFIIGELAEFKGEDLFSGVLACVFTGTFLFYILKSSNAFFEKQINQSKELLKEALIERKKAVVITNAEKTVEYVNEAFLNIIGYRHRDVIGRKLSFLRGELTTPESVEFMREKLNEKVDFEVDIVNYRKNGEAYLCHISMIPVISDNQLTHFIVYKEDVQTISGPKPLDEDWIIFEKINAYFIENEPCKNPQLQVANIADAMGLSARRTSEVLKRCGDQSFTEYVNSSRIKAALKMLRNPAFQHLTVEAIGQIAGFNSKSIFYAAFKKETGKTPKIFIEENKD